MSLRMIVPTCILMLTYVAASAQSQESVVIIRVEEDWSLEVSEPDSETSSPQISTQMNPHHDYPDAYALFCVNYREIPTFWGGGLEIQLWEDEDVLDVDVAAGYALSRIGETIRWTQVLQVKDGKISFSIKDGVSQSFADFGGENFRVEQPSGLSNLEDYSVDDSVKNSGVSLGANRVNSLKLLEVRYIKSDGSVVTDDVDKTVYESGQ